MLDMTDTRPAKPGISLLEWYAGQALVGLLASGADPDDAPAEAFIIAAAMVTEGDSYAVKEH